MIAEVLHIMAAEPAIAVDPAHPGDAHTCSDGEGRSCAVHHLTNDLMAWDDARLNCREVTFDDVEIGSADATGDDLEQHFSWL